MSMIREISREQHVLIGKISAIRHKLMSIIVEPGYIIEPYKQVTFFNVDYNYKYNKNPGLYDYFHGFTWNGKFVSN